MPQLVFYKKTEPSMGFKTRLRKYFKFAFIFSILLSIILYIKGIDLFLILVFVSIISSIIISHGWRINKFMLQDISLKCEYLKISYLDKEKVCVQSIPLKQINISKHFSFSMTRSAYIRISDNDGFSIYQYATEDISESEIDDISFNIQREINRRETKTA